MSAEREKNGEEGCKETTEIPTEKSVMEGMLAVLGEIEKEAGKIRPPREPRTE